MTTKNRTGLDETAESGTTGASEATVSIDARLAESIEGTAHETGRTSADVVGEFLRHGCVNYEDILRTEEYVRHMNG